MRKGREGERERGAKKRNKRRKSKEGKEERESSARMECLPIDLSMPIIASLLIPSSSTTPPEPTSEKPEVLILPSGQMQPVRFPISASSEMEKVGIKKRCPPAAGAEETSVMYRRRSWRLGRLDIVFCCCRLDTLTLIPSKVHMNESHAG